MKILIIGAGYVGMALLRCLQDEPHEIFITTTDKNRMASLKAYGKEIFLLDPIQQDDFSEWIQRCEAAIILVAPKGAKNYAETYLDTARKMQAALKDRQTPFYLLYTSSTSVCEGLDQDGITEETIVFPVSEQSKILGETEQCYLNSRANVCILRLGGIYGPGRELRERARRFSGKEMPGTGEEATNHIHLEDITRAIIFCLEKRLTGLYHLVNDDHRSRKALYFALCAKEQLPPVKWNPALPQIRGGGVKICNEKIKKAGFNFKHPKLFI